MELSVLKLGKSQANWNELATLAVKEPYMTTVEARALHEEGIL